MKRLYTIFVLLFIVMIPATCVMAETQANISLSVDKQDVRVNDVITVTVKAENITNVYGIKLVLNYDESMLTYKDKTLKSSTFTTVGSKFGQGSITYLGSKIGDVPGSSGNVILATLQFTAIKEGKVSLALGSIDPVDKSGTTLKANANADFTFNIQRQAAEIVEPVKEQPAATPVPAAPEVSQTQAQTQVQTQVQNQAKTENQAQANVDSNVKKSEDTNTVTNKAQETAVQSGSDKVNTVDAAVNSDNKAITTSEEIPVGSKNNNRKTELLLGCIGVLAIFDAYIFFIVFKKKKLSI